MKIYNNTFIDSFLYEKKINEGLKKASIKSYCSVFNALEIDIYIDINNLDSFTNINFKYCLGELSIANNWSNYTYNRYIKNLSVFCDYLVENNHIEKNPITGIKLKKLDKALPKSFTRLEVKKILNIVNYLYGKDIFLHKRNKTIFNLFLHSGLRLSELLDLQIQNIDLLSGIIKIKKGKGNKDRIIPLNNNIIDLLISYMLFRKKENLDSLFLFPSKTGLRLQHKHIYNIFKKVQDKALFRITPHMLRHTFATELVRKNINIYNISRVLGHSDLKTTQIYLSTNVDNIKDSFNAVGLYT